MTITSQRTGTLTSPTLPSEPAAAPAKAPKTDNDPALVLRVDGGFQAATGDQAQRKLTGSDSRFSVDPRLQTSSTIPAGQLAAAAQAREVKPAQTQAVEPNQTLAEVKDFKWVSQFDKKVPGHGNTACLRANEWSAKQAGVKLNPAADRIQVATKEDKKGHISGVDKAAAQRGTDYVDSQLAAGKPVVVGVTDRKTGTNVDNITDHFVSITGKKTDKDGKTYYEFRDPGTKNADRSVGRLDVDARGVLVGKSPYNGVHYEVAMVRTNAN